MQKQRWSQAVTRKAVCSLLVLLGLFSVLSAQVRIPQSQNAPQPLPGEQEPGTSPLFMSKITLKLTFDDGSWFEVTQLEGRTITLEQDGATFGFIPRFEDNQVKINTFRISVVKDGERILSKDTSEIREFALAQEKPDIYLGDLNVKIDLLSIKKERVSKTISLAPPVHLTDDADVVNDGYICCVTCMGGRKMCACAITSSCGGCCVGPCC